MLLRRLAIKKARQSPQMMPFTMMAFISSIGWSFLKAVLFHVDSPINGQKLNKQSALGLSPGPSKIERCIGHAWCGDEFAQGTWCTYKPSTFVKNTDELLQRQWKLFFRSGDHDEGWRGFIEVAIIIGPSTAVNLAYRLGAWTAMANEPFSSVK